MYDYSGGVPRRINNLASRVLLFGALEERNDIDEAVVNEVIDDLRRDNTPTTGPRRVLEDVDLSSIGPLQGNIPPKMQAGAGQGASERDVYRRLDQLERAMRSHEQALRQILELLSEWAREEEEEDETAAAPRPAAAQAE